MSESGFDVLNKFAPVNGGTITYAPYKPTAEQENEIIDAGQMAQKNQITNEIAERQVNDTNMFNYYANLYAGQMLPIKQAQDLAMENYALQLGLGKRYTAEDFRAIVEEAVGPIEETSAGRKFTRFIVDSFNARTPYKGAAGALDVYLQALGKKFEREDLLKAQKLERRLMVGELMANQALKANENIKAVEADYYLKKMGYDNDTAKEYLNFSDGILQKIAQTNLDIEKDKIKASLDALKNPDKLLNIQYVQPNGELSDPLSAREIMTDSGPQIMLGRVVQTEKGPIQVFDIPVPAGPDGLLQAIKLGTQNVGDNTKALNDQFISAEKIQAGAQDLFALQNIKQDVFSILDSAKDDISVLGVTGSILKTVQETKFVTQSLFDLIGRNTGKGSIGSDLFKEGEILFNNDKINQSEMLSTVGVTTIDAPKKIGPIETGTEQKQVQASINDLFDENWWMSQGYDRRFAQNKVREQFIVYGLARALKPTGRLNVDDVRRASDAVSLYGIQDPRAVIAKLQEVYNKISQAQDALIGSAPEILSKEQDIDRVRNLLIELGRNPDDYTQFFAKPVDSVPTPTDQDTITTPDDVERDPVPANSFKIDDLGFGS